MKLSVEQFSHDVVTCGLLAGAELDSVKTRWKSEGGSDSTGLAKKLVSAGKLTKYQAANAVQGKAKNLVFGEYTILSAIGAGGMGQVFKAEHRRMKRVVALKVLPPAAVKSPEAVKRFQQEVQAAARLEHANIVTAHDAGEAHGVHYLVMQYVDGRDLASLVAERGALPVTKAIDYILQAAHGLAYAHGKGVIHRDIKPANLLLSNEGVIKILDMGIARLDDVLPAVGKQPMTTSGEVMGTADFMAPEQADDAHQADARADIYSLGCTLHFLLTGQPPYGGSTLVQKMMAHRDQLIPSLVLKRGDVSPALDQVFARMMAKKPADRFQTMQEVVAALQSLGTTAPGTINGAWAAPVRALTDGAATIANAPGDTASGSSKTVASLLEHEVVKKTWSATAKVAGGMFGTIIAPILVTFILKYLDKPEADQMASVVPASAPTPAVAPTVTPSTATATPAAVTTSESPAQGATATSSAATDKIAALPVVDQSAGRPVDVMALIDLKRDALRGDWTLRNGMLHGPAALPKHSSQLQLPVKPPAEYDLLLSMGRPPGAAKSNVGFSVAVVVEDRYRVGVLIDSEGKKGRHWGLEQIDGHGPFANGTMATEKPILGSTPVKVAVKVRRGEVAVTCNDMPVIDWRGAADQLSLPGGWTGIPSDPALLFVTRTEVDIHEIKFVPGGDDWKPLFNGRNLRGWTTDDAKVWKADAKTGELTGKGGSRSQWIVTDRDHRDFRLRLEFEMKPGTNSGICIRELPEDKELQHFQLELASDPLKPKTPPTGTLRNAPARGQNIPPDKPARLKPAGSWNELEIDHFKNRLRVWLNGDRLHDVDLAKLAGSDNAVPALKRKSGRIGLQVLDGEARFRNVVIHETDTKAAR